DDVGPAEAGAARQRAWQAIVQCSQQMLELARQQQWNQVIGLQAHRQRQIERFFATPPRVDEAAWIETGIRAVLAADRGTMDLGKQGMRALTSELQGFEVGRRAIRAYNLCSG
ncbi:MAG: flagellar protein FliT, partial [Gammaproteobacteria bacterium]